MSHEYKHYIKATACASQKHVFADIKESFEPKSHHTLYIRPPIGSYKSKRVRGGRMDGGGGGVQWVKEN